jgi:hypothetical protein
MSDGPYHRYLLGELPEEERDVLEDAYFSSDEGFAELQAAEDDLRDAYVAGRLPPDRRARFEARYLRTEDDRQRLQQARLLQLAAARARSSEEDRGRARRWPPLLGWAAALAGLAVAGLLFAQLTRARSELREARAAREALADSVAAQEERSREQGLRLADAQRELERLRTEAARLTALASATREAGRLVSLVLGAGLRRDLDPVPQLRLPPEATLVRLTLRLDADAGPGDQRASIQTAEGREVWAQADLRPRTTAHGTAAVVEVPAAVLGPGHHVVVLSRGGTALAEYVFQVRRD